MNYVYIQYWYICIRSWLTCSVISNCWPVAGTCACFRMTLSSVSDFIYLKLFCHFSGPCHELWTSLWFANVFFSVQFEIFSIFRGAIPQIVVRPHATINGVFYVIRITYHFFPGTCATRRGPSSDFRLCLVASVRTTTWSDAAIEYLVWWTTILV